MSSNDFSIDVMIGSCWIQRPWLVRRSWCLYGWRQCLPCWTHSLTGIKDFFITITIKQNTCTVWGIWSVVAHYSSLLDDLIWILFPVLHLTPVCFPAFYWLGFVPCSTLCCSVSLVSSLLDELLLILCLCYSVLRPVLVSVVLDGNSGPSIRPIMSVIADLPCGCRPQFTPPSSRSKSSESKGSVLFQ